MGEIYFKLFKGKGVCLFEDCGGIWGYYYMVEVINDFKYEDYEDMVEWMCVEEWDVNEFDEVYVWECMFDWFNNVRNFYGMFF